MIEIDLNALENRIKKIECILGEDIDYSLIIDNGNGR